MAHGDLMRSMLSALLSFCPAAFAQEAKKKQAHKNDAIDARVGPSRCGDKFLLDFVDKKTEVPS